MTGTLSEPSLFFFATRSLVHILTARWCSVSGLLPGEQVKADEVTVVNDVALRDPPEDNKRRGLKGSSHKSISTGKFTSWIGKNWTK
jgi:hypothetical protein